MSDNKQYLGDGVYADFDGYQIVLTVQDGVETTNRIYLESPVYAALVAYVERLKRPAPPAEQEARPHNAPSLPQSRDLEGIDITGGVDPTEYIRRLRE